LEERWDYDYVFCLDKSQSPEDVEIIKDKELKQNDAKLLDSFKEVPIDNAGDKYQNKNIDI